MTATGIHTLIGAGVDRVDGPAKVTGAAAYPSDVTYPDLAHVALVRSTVATGRISRIDTDAAGHAPGVLSVITHETAPRLERGPAGLLGPAPPPPLQDDRILYHGQYVAAVVAETPHAATAAARLVEVAYDAGEPVLDIADPRGALEVNPWGADTSRGDVGAALASAEATIRATYTTVENTNNPLGLFATVAAWDGDTVTVHDATQWTSNVQAFVAGTFGIPPAAVRVQAQYVGGAFGAGLLVWPHVTLAVLAARAVGRPVRLLLTRPQMFTGVGHRPGTVQTLSLGATRDGRIVAIDHESTVSAAIEDESIQRVTGTTANAYTCENVSTRDQRRRLHIPPTGWMRAPSEAPGNFALESAIDELSYELGVDPLELRLRNYAEVQPTSGRPWSSKALRECYEVGAERFGWSRRDPEVGSMRDGHWRVGYGVAGVSYAWWQVRCEARAGVLGDGTAFVRSAATDIGTGTRTVMRQLSADLLGVDLDRVRFDLGDSELPWSPAAGGSGLTTSLGTAVQAACRSLVERFLAAVRDDAESPLRGCGIDDVTVAAGRIHRRDDPDAGEAYADILARHALTELTADGTSHPPEPTDVARSGAFAAKFVEVRVDPDLGLVRVARVVSAIDGGRILNPKLARSQIIGGTVGGLGQALMEETVTDPATGRIANATLADYLVPVNADVRAIDVVFVGEPDTLTALGTKGVGEIGVPGIAAAIANGVYHATGRRIRSLPIAVEQLL